MLNTILGDITKIKDVDAIVNAANKSLLGGEAKITDAYNLSCKYVIHTVGPIWYGGKDNEAELLANCYYHSLELAVENEIKKIAFPSISTGVYSFPVDLAAKIAVGTVKRFLDANPETLQLVEWVLFDETTYSYYEKEVDAIYG